MSTMNAMKRTRQRPADELIELAAVLVFVQGVVALVATIEVGIVTAAMGGLTLVAFVLTGMGAMLTLLMPRGLRRRSRRARRTVVVLQILWLISATIDVLLALLLARRGLEPVPTLTRIVLPISLWRLLRRPQVRAAFGVKPARRQRRQTTSPEPASDDALVGVSP